jgi:hypothetical protein
VESRGVDLTAVTALETLRRGLGYGNTLEALNRADLWGVWTATEGEELLKLSGALVSGTSVFINPNKHRWRSWAGEHDGADLACECAWSLVWALDDTDGRAALATLRSSGFRRTVTWVAKGTLWTIRAASSARDKELDLAEEITVATHRDRGLLANPHIHKWTCGLGNIPLDQVLDLLGHARNEAGVPSVS